MALELTDFRAMGRQIRKRRQMEGLTLSDLSERTGISLPFLGHIERGTRKATVETLLKIAYALNATPNDLLCDSLPSRASTGFYIDNNKTADVVRNIIDVYLGLHPASEKPCSLFADISAADWIMESIVMSAFRYGAQYNKTRLSPKMDGE